MRFSSSSSIVEEGLSYRYHASWPFVLQALGSFYRVAGKRAHPVMMKVTVDASRPVYCDELLGSVGVGD